MPSTRENPRGFQASQRPSLPASQRKFHGRASRRGPGWVALIVVVAVGLSAAGPARAGCVEDDTGARVCVEKTRPRVISLYGAFTELLWEIGGGDLLVARTRNDRSIPEVRELPSVGTGLKPNVEHVMALRPDLVVARAGRAARRAVESLRSRGLHVAAFDPRGLDDLYRTVERLGVLAGREAEARALVERLRERMGALRRLTAAARPVRVVYEVRSQPLTVAGQDSLMTEIIEAAGGVNAVPVRKKILMLDVEALLRMDPEAYIVQEGPMNRNPMPPSERPHLGALRAVRDGRVLVVDEARFARPGPHVAEAAESLARFLHPELFGGR